jgi:hypothetical protein
MKQIRRCCGIFAHRYNVLTGEEKVEGLQSFPVEVIVCIWTPPMFKITDCVVSYCWILVCSLFGVFYLLYWTQITVMVDDEQKNCRRELTACTAHNFPTHRWIKIVCGSHSAFCKWLPNEIPLRVVFLIVQHEGVINFKRKSAPGILKTCNLSNGTTFTPIHLVTLSL